MTERDTAIKSWLASMSKSELIDELLFWHDTALEHGRMYNAIKYENAKLREYAAKAWSLFVRHGAVHACDLSEVDAVRDGLRELRIEERMRDLGVVDR